MSDFNTITEAFGIKKGLTAVVGSGGKTSFIDTLSKELKGKIIISTSTHIYPFENYPVYTGSDISELKALLESEGTVQVGSPCDDGKLSSPSIPFSEVKGICDYLLVEADGSRGLPLKMHNDNEPQIPECQTSVIVVFGLSGIGKTVSEAFHRAEILKSTFGLKDNEIVNPGTVAVSFTEEWISGKFGRHPHNISLFFNQNDIEKDSGSPTDDALSVLSYLPKQVIESLDKIVIGSIKNSSYSVME